MRLPGPQQPNVAIARVNLRGQVVDARADRLNHLSLTSARTSSGSARPTGPGSSSLQHVEDTAEGVGIDARIDDDPPPAAEHDLDPCLVRSGARGSGFRGGAGDGSGTTIAGTKPDAEPRSDPSARRARRQLNSSEREIP